MNTTDRIAAFLLGSLQGDDLQMFLDDLQNNASLQRELREAEAIWIASGKRSQSATFDAESAWNDFEELVNLKDLKESHVVAKESKPSLPSTSVSPSNDSLTRIAKVFKLTRAQRVAAVAFLLVSLAGVLFFLFPSTHRFTAGRLHKAVDHNEMIGLSDGSNVMLATNATLVVDQAYNQNNRVARLSGLAFFVVKPDKDKTFEVVTDHLRVLVKGTTFLVRTDDHSTAVGVRTGKVQVKIGFQTYELSPGEELIFSEEGGVNRLSSFEDSTFKALASSLYSFENVTLRSILSYLEEYKGLKISLADHDSQLGNQTFTLSFNNLSNTEIIQLLELVTQRNLIEIQTNVYRFE